MNTHKQIIQDNALVNSLIKVGRDDFDINIALELRAMAECIQHRRSISLSAARKVVRHLLSAD